MSDFTIGYTVFIIRTGDDDSPVAVKSEHTLSQARDLDLVNELE